MLWMIFSVIMFSLVLTIGTAPQSIKEPCAADVLVLGAGMAGAKAAADLVDAGLKVIVLEHAAKVGGRMKAINWKGETIELGANWIEGIPQKDNPIWAIAQEINLQGNYTNQEDSAIRPTLFDENGAVPPEVAAAVHRKLTSAMQGAQRVFCNRRRHNMSDISLREALVSAGWPEPEKQTHLERTLEFFVIDWDFEYPPEEVSTFNYYAVGHADSWEKSCPTNAQQHKHRVGGRFQGFPRARTAARMGLLGNFSWESPRYFVTDPRGYAAVAEHVVRALPQSDGSSSSARDTCPEQSTILTSKTVVSIRYGAADQSCTVQTNDGSVFVARFCISTFSSGVILASATSGGPKLFDPPLPPFKINAFKTAPNGIYTKIFLKFETKFWANADYALFADPDRRGYFSVWQDLESHHKFFPSDAHILMVTVVQAQSEKVETQDTRKTVEEIMAVLRKMYSGRVVTEPLDIFLPRWNADPAFRGCWSNIQVGGGAFEQMQEAIGPLFFAGEATDPDYNGFTLGGFTSGARAAQDVLRRVKTTL